jgi:hypothetical protein
MPENSIAQRKRRPALAESATFRIISPMTGASVLISPPMARTGDVIMDDD